MGLQLSSIPVAKVSHMAKPHIKGWGLEGVKYTVLICGRGEKVIPVQVSLTLVHDLSLAMK